MPVVQLLDTFLADFMSHLKNAKKHIYVQSMVISDGEVVGLLEKELIEAKKRNVEIKVQMDWVYTKYNGGHIDLFPFLNRKLKDEQLSAKQKNEAMVQRFQDNGIPLKILNYPGLLTRILPIAGRNHIKIYLVDDVVWIGGLNYYDDSFTTFDFMVKFDNFGMVEAVKEQFFRVENKKNTTDTLTTISPTETLLVDCGARGESIILSTAVEQVLKAQTSVVMVSQMVPEGKLLDAMVQVSKKGVPVTIITSQEKERAFTEFPYNIPYQFYKYKTSSYTRIKLVHMKQHVHAKLLVVDGKTAIFGSHNFVDTGVHLGTTEMSVLTTNQALVNDLVALL